MKNSIEILGGELLLLDTYLIPLQYIVLMLILSAATVTDVRERRIPNWLVATGMLAGILFHTATTDGAGASFALSGLSIGIVAFFPFFALGLLGAGDVKLIGMIGAFVGIPDILSIVLASMAAGGVLALGMAAGKRVLPELFANVHLMLLQRRFRQTSGAADGAIQTLSSVGKMPYAVAILAGTLIQLFLLRY